ncbi:winged helix-turn-helix transcriptional regulator [Candidatus Lokiarchaeum ossiferum]
MIISNIILLHYRWAIPIIAEIFRNNGVKYIYLHKKLKINKSVLSKTLQVLEESNYIKKNPGYGHPLRPEYIINENAFFISEKCRNLYDSLIEMNMQHILATKWIVPILLVIQNKKLRFSEIKKELDNITSRSLTIALKKLENEEFLERTTTSAYPPTSHYQIKKKFHLLFPILLNFNQ